MRSKWLDWTPEVGFVGFEGSRPGVFPITRVQDGNGTPRLDPPQPAIIEKVPAREPTKPTEPASPTADNPMLQRPDYFWGTHRDSYGWRVHLALEAMCQISVPEGLAVWLGEHSPDLYRKLTEDLPDEVSRAWDAGVRFEKFDALCLEWVGTVRLASEVYTLEHVPRKPEELL